MREPLRQVDANLLLSLHALLEERNLTYAGARMAMSQPAMSGALTRLRRHFDDELLVRTGRDFTLTPLAQELRAEVAAAVKAAESLLGAHQAFHPDTSTRRFAVSMSEYAMTVAAEPLARAVHERAPGCTIAFDTLASSPEQLESQLLRRDLMAARSGSGFPASSSPCSPTAWSSSLRTRTPGSATAC